MYAAAKTVRNEYEAAICDALILSSPYTTFGNHRITVITNTNTMTDGLTIRRVLDQLRLLHSVPLTDASAQHGPVPSSIQAGLNAYDMQALRDLEALVHDLFVFRFSGGFYIAMVAAAALLLLLVVSGRECVRQG